MKLKNIITPILVGGLFYLPFADTIVRHIPAKNGNDIVVTIDTDKQVKNESHLAKTAQSLASDFASYKTSAVSKAAAQAIVLYLDVDVALKSRTGDITRHYKIPVYGDAFDNNPELAKLFKKYNFVCADTSFTTQKEDDVLFNQGYVYKVSLSVPEDSLVSRIKNGEPTTAIIPVPKVSNNDYGFTNGAAGIYSLDGKVHSRISNTSSGIYLYFNQNNVTQKKTIVVGNRKR